MQKDGLDEAVKFLHQVGERENLGPEVFAQELVESINFFKCLEGQEIMGVHPEFKSLQVYIERRLSGVVR